MAYWVCLTPAGSWVVIPVCRWPNDNKFKHEKVRFGHLFNPHFFMLKFIIIRSLLKGWICVWDVIVWVDDDWLVDCLSCPMTEMLPAGVVTRELLPLELTQFEMSYYHHRGQYKRYAVMHCTYNIWRHFLATWPGGQGQFYPAIVDAESGCVYISIRQQKCRNNRTFAATESSLLLTVFVPGTRTSG